MYDLQVTWSDLYFRFKQKVQIQHILTQNWSFEYEIDICIIKDDPHLQIMIVTSSMVIIWLNRKFSRTPCVCPNKRLSSICYHWNINTFL